MTDLKTGLQELKVLHRLLKALIEELEDEIES